MKNGSRFVVAGVDIRGKSTLLNTPVVSVTYQKW